MPKCKICGEDEDKLYKCKKCGTQFCEWCGDIEEMICMDCLDAEEDDDSAEDDDDDFAEDDDARARDAEFKVVDKEK